MKFETIQDIGENLGWSVGHYGDSRDIEFEQSSPAGEDFCFEIKADGNEAEWVRNYADDFDADEHVTGWAESKLNGDDSVPSWRELVDDADAIQEMLDALADALEESEE